MVIGAIIILAFSCGYVARAIGEMNWKREECQMCAFWVYAADKERVKRVNKTV